MRDVVIQVLTHPRVYELEGRMQRHGEWCALVQAHCPKWDIGCVKPELDDSSANAEAISDLVLRCPELIPPVADLHEWMDGEEGIYNVFAHIIVPTLRYVLTDAAPQKVGIEEPLLSALPERATPNAQDFVMRLYQVLDGWAASTHEYIRNAVSVELLEYDWPELTVARILEPAGPALRDLKRST